MLLFVFTKKIQKKKLKGGVLVSCPANAVCRWRRLHLKISTRGYVNAALP
jgi:hypothetical protein